MMHLRFHEKKKTNSSFFASFDSHACTYQENVDLDIGRYEMGGGFSLLLIANGDLNRQTPSSSPSFLELERSILFKNYTFLKTFFFKEVRIRGKSLLE